MFGAWTFLFLHGQYLLCNAGSQHAPEDATPRKMMRSVVVDVHGDAQMEHVVVKASEALAREVDAGGSIHEPETDGGSIHEPEPDAQRPKRMTHAVTRDPPMKRQQQKKKAAGQDDATFARLYDRRRRYVYVSPYRRRRTASSVSTRRRYVSSDYARRRRYVYSYPRRRTYVSSPLPRRRYVSSHRRRTIASACDVGICHKQDECFRKDNFASVCKAAIAEVSRRRYASPSCLDPSKLNAAMWLPATEKQRQCKEAYDKCVKPYADCNYWKISCSAACVCSSWKQSGSCQTFRGSLITESMNARANGSVNSTETNGVDDSLRGKCL